MANKITVQITEDNIEEFTEHFLNKEKEVQITPVSLEEILDVMEMKPEIAPDGRIRVYDQQRGEYIPTLVGQGDDDLGFENAAKIFERLDIYINDYFITDMEEQLEAGGVTLTGNETLKDLCDYAKEQLKAGITTVSQGELNLAIGIVHPETVIMPEGFIDQAQTTTFTLQNATSEQIAELKKHLSMNGYDISWKENSKESNEVKFTASIDDEVYIATILDDRNIIHERSNKYGTVFNNQLKESDEKTNYILEKLAKAGIEVVTDKDEFNRILENQSVLQKMTKNNSVEDLFISKNEENLDSEIDKVTVNDVNLYHSYINISKTTPFVFKEFGLDEYPVNIYKQKLARALFLEKEKYGERLTHGHKGEFTDKEVKEVFRNIGNTRYIFNSKQNINNPKNFYLIGVYDTFDKQGNPMMLSLHYNKNRKEVEANWVTAVYGKNANILVNDWTRKGYSVYKNDLEIEKASEEAVALYMRVSNLHEAYKDNIKLKSDYVNSEGVFFFVQNNTTYGFTHNDKIYLNPDVMNSEVAVHEYTHLWDAYTQKTNPELWNKGLQIFKNISIWNEVIEDENYADIKNDENLVLSECHAKICGKIADTVLQKVLEHDGNLKQAAMIDWNKEVDQYIYENFESNRILSNGKEIKAAGYGAFGTVVDVNSIRSWFASPMKDLFQNELNIKLEQNELTKENLTLLSQYEEAVGLKENIPKSVLEQLSKNSNELTAEDLKNARTLLPKEQYQVVLGYTQGEEGEHFKGIIKEISSKAEAIKGKTEILTEDEKHPLAFKYTIGSSSFYFSEWDGEDKLFGYVVLNGDTQNSEWGYTSLEELKNAGEKNRNGFPIMPEMTFYGLEATIEKQISVDYPELSEKMRFAPTKNHNEELISEFGKEIFETLQSRKLEQNTYNICCAAQFVLRSMDFSERKKVFSMMEKCGCKGKNGKANTEDFLTEVVKAENNTVSSVYDRKRLYEKINKSCIPKIPEATKGMQNPESDYDIEI